MHADAYHIDRETHYFICKSQTVDKDYLDDVAAFILKDKTGAMAFPVCYALKNFLFEVYTRNPDDVLDCLNRVADNIDGKKDREVSLFLENIANTMIVSTQTAAYVKKSKMLLNKVEKCVANASSTSRIPFRHRLS